MLKHTPTEAQSAKMAELRGQNAMSYALDRSNWLPDEFVGKFVGEFGVAIHVFDDEGRVGELVVLPNGECFGLG